MVIMITAYGREVLADARDQRAALRRFSPGPVTPKQLADSVLHALHDRAPRPTPPPRPVERTSGCGACVCW